MCNFLTCVAEPLVTYVCFQFQLVRSALNDSTTASITLVANQDELSQHSSPQEQPDDMAMDIHKAQNSQETETDLVNVCCYFKLPLRELILFFLLTVRIHIKVYYHFQRN